jgi:hypothetical protein
LQEPACVDRLKLKPATATGGPLPPACMAPVTHPTHRMKGTVSHGVTLVKCKEGNCTKERKKESWPDQKEHLAAMPGRDKGTTLPPIRTTSKYKLLSPSLVRVLSPSCVRPMIILAIPSLVSQLFQAVQVYLVVNSTSSVLQKSEGYSARPFASIGQCTRFKHGASRQKKLTW